jgi:hypothetical protein
VTIDRQATAISSDEHPGVAKLPAAIRTLTALGGDQACLMRAFGCKTSSFASLQSPLAWTTHPAPRRPTDPRRCPHLRAGLPGTDILRAYSDYAGMPQLSWSFPRHTSATPEDLSPLPNPSSRNTRRQGERG